ncbi:hypothetical protein EV127DRAFT_79368 [Xylaria flabelliformis]|nr:hypothetical protein EV127DRAFT_79368 [Xylaria flabelliformis]
MSTFLTTINNKKCTATPRAKNAGGGTTATVATSSSFSSSSTSSSSTSIALTSISISTSISTTFSTSSTPSTSPTSSTSIPALVLTTTAPVGGNINAPDPDTSTSAAQETLPSTTSSTSSQSVPPTSIPISSAIGIGAPSIPSAIPSSTPALVTESQTSSTTSSPDFTAVTATQTKDQGSSSTIQTNDGLAPTITSVASSGASISTSAIIGGSIATTTTTGSEQLESSNSGGGLTNGAQNNVTGSGRSTQTTVAVAGGVIGGLALVSIIAFLFWFWRKRLMKKRRSTLLTPLSTGQANGRGEKGPYIINRNSLGPTTIPEKVRAVVGYNYHRLRGRVNSLVTRSPRPSVDLNRGNSQFGIPDTPASRSASGAGVDTNRPTTVKGRFVDWWGRMTEEGNMNWKSRNEPKGGRPNNDTYTSMSKVAQPKKKGSQPDFLTLLSMDEKQQQQQQGTTSNNTGAGSSNPRRSQSLGNDHFLGGLGLNFEIENPFADSNAMSHDSAKVKPLAVPGPETSNPFSDANALPGPARPANAGGPATYVQNIRRSRGHSVSAASTRPPSNTRMPSIYRESRVSVETSDTRQNKYRSDPFDLDRPELLAQSPGSRPGSSGTRSGGYGNARVGLPSAPRPTHARNESFTSKYSSGVSSMGDWSDPGPDVGPGAGRWDTPSPEGALGRLGTGGKGEGTQRSVGKAI